MPLPVPPTDPTDTTTLYRWIAPHATSARHDRFTFKHLSTLHGAQYDSVTDTWTITGVLDGRTYDLTAA